jgi:hypothetical protein
MTRDVPEVGKLDADFKSAGSDARIRAAAPEFTIALHGSVLVLVWHGPTTLLGMQTARELSAPPDVEMTLVLVESVMRPPDPLTKRELSLWAKDFNPRSVAVVFEGEGFAAAALRAVIVGIRALKTTRGTSEIFASVQAATAWLKQNHPGAPGVADLASYVETLRRPRRQRSKRA